MRAIARRAGVSAAAPYRHFADRDALESAVAVEGFTDLRAELEAALAVQAAGAIPDVQAVSDVQAISDVQAAPDGQAESSVTDEQPAASVVDVITALGLAYVTFALRRPAVFRLMFGGACDEVNSERVRAAGRLHELLGDVIARLFPGTDAASLSIALWSMAHGLAFLHLDGKLRPEPAADVADRVRGAVAAVLAARAEPGLPGGRATKPAPAAVRQDSASPADAPHRHRTH